jgi:hypothetical protein
MYHSCSPVAALRWDPKTLTMTLYAVRNVDKGEEITISYIDPLHPLAERQRILRQKYGFTCSCAKCSLDSGPRTVSDENRTKLRKWLSDPNRRTFQNWLSDTEGEIDRKKVQAYSKELIEFLKLLKNEHLQVLRSVWMEVTDLIARMLIAMADPSSRSKLEVARDVWNVDKTIISGIEDQVGLYESWIQDPGMAPFFGLRSSK